MFRAVIAATTVSLIPITTAADTEEIWGTTDLRVESLQGPRLDVGLSSTELAMFTGVAIGLFVAAGKQEDCPPPPSLCLSDLSSAFFNAGGAASLVFSVWPAALVGMSTRELRRRRSDTIDYNRSIRFNRNLIAYDSVMTTGYVGAAVGMSLVVGSQRAWTAGLVGSALLAGLHLWSLSHNAKELKRRKRVGRNPQRGRIELTITGLRW